jgi:hypothetical protein
LPTNRTKKSNFIGYYLLILGIAVVRYAEMIHTYRGVEVGDVGNSRSFLKALPSASCALLVVEEHGCVRFLELWYVTGGWQKYTANVTRSGMVMNSRGARSSAESQHTSVPGTVLAAGVYSASPSFWYIVQRWC